MSERIPHFPFYPADFMHGVRGLTAQEVGVYTMLLCRIYEEDGPVEWNVLRLSTYCGMRQATFTKTVERLLDLGKLTIESGMLSNARAMVEISSRANKLKINSKAGKASAEKRLQNQQNTATGVQRSFNHTDTDTERSSSSRSAREAENEAENPAQRSAEIVILTPEADSLYEHVLAAVGFNRSTMPAYWMPPGAIIHVNRWLALGLTAEEIIATARHNRAAHKDPPNGPKALDRAMQITASAKQMPDLMPIAAPSSAKGVRHDQSAQASDRMQRIILAAARGSTD